MAASISVLVFLLVAATATGEHPAWNASPLPGLLDATRASSAAGSRVAVASSSNMFGKGGVRSNSSRKLLLEAVDLDAPGSSKEVKAPAAGVRIYPGDLPPKTAGKKAEKRDSPDVGDSSGAKAGGEDGPGKREAKDAGDHGGAYYMKDDALSKKEAASAPSPVLKLPLSAMSFLGGGGAGEGEGGSCPDVANCDMVCSGQAHSHSMCSTSQGHGTYTAGCCSGSGRVCPSPPCSGGASSLPSASGDPSSPLSSIFGARPGGFLQKLRPQLVSSPPDDSGHHHHHHHHRSSHPFAPLLGSLNKMLSGSSNIIPHIVHLGPGGSLGGLFGGQEGADGDCSRVTPLSAEEVQEGAKMRRSVFFRGDSFSREQNRSLPSRQVQEGANMRDSVFFGSSNCYEVALPEGADHIRLGIIATKSGGMFGGASSSSSSSILPVSVYSSPAGWPERTEAFEVELKEKDAGVRWARVVAGEGPKVFVRVAAHESKGMMPVSYQVMFAMPRHLRGPAAWYTPLEDIFVEHLFLRAVWVVYAILGAFVGLALSTQRAAVQEKSVAVAYIMLLTFGVFAAHRFYLNRTASAIIWYSMLLLLTTGMAMDFAFLRGPWSTYPHHHILWGGILGVISMGLVHDMLMIPSMASDKGYWERSRKSRLKRKYARGKKFETIAEGDEGDIADIDEGEVELGGRAVDADGEAHGPPAEDLEAASPPRPHLSGNAVRRGTSTAGANVGGRFNIQWRAEDAAGPQEAPRDWVAQPLLQDEAPRP